MEFRKMRLCLSWSGVRSILSLPFMRHYHDAETAVHGGGFVRAFFGFLNFGASLTSER
jgi:hypothetical protein